MGSLERFDGFFLRTLGGEIFQSVLSRGVGGKGAVRGSNVLMNRMAGWVTKLSSASKIQTQHWSGFGESEGTTSLMIRITVFSAYNVAVPEKLVFYAMKHRTPYRHVQNKK